MCILFIALNQHPTYPLIITANRDEYFARPSKEMHYWADKPDILGGRDLLKGGSWLGINKTGDFCAVTNFRTSKLMDPSAISRGELIARYLNYEPNSLQNHHGDFISYLRAHSRNYNPFNLVFGNIHGLWVFSSESNDCEPLENGFHSISNGKIDHPWPKMSLGVDRLTTLISNGSPNTHGPNVHSRDIDFDSLHQIMVDQTQASDDQLPNTGIEPEKERMLSSIFIPGGQYGTRTTSMLLYSRNQIQVREINYDSSSNTRSQQDFKLKTT